MREQYIVSLVLHDDTVTHDKRISVGVKRPSGEFRWVCDWLVGEHLYENALEESIQVADDLWQTLIGRTFGVQESLL